MNTKLALSAIVAALMLTACAKQESAAPTRLQILLLLRPPQTLPLRPLLLDLRLPARRTAATPPSLLKALRSAG